MVSMTSAPAAPGVSLPGPRICRVPPYVSSAGQEAIDAYELTGQRLDPWQKATLIDACGERADGRWAAFEFALNVARQNGKDEVLIARELAGLFVWGERLIGHSAHLFDTAMEHLERLVSLIEDVPEFSRRVRKVNRSHGQEGITLRSGARIRFRARTRSGSFRGFTGDCMIFNEAMDIPDALIGSIMPVLSARSTRVPGPQVCYAASAVDRETMPNGMVLARLRAAAIKGDNDRLAYFEHSVDVRGWLEAHGLRFDPERPELEQVTPEMLSDPEMWAQANPALDVRISREHVTTEFHAPSMTLRQFAIERGGVGDYPDTDEDAGRVVSAEAWGRCGERDSRNRIVSAPFFAVDVNPDQTWGSIGVGGVRADGLPQVAVVAHDRGTGWIVEACVGLKGEHRRARFVVDKRGPAADLIRPLTDAGLDVVEVSTEDYRNACGGFFNAVTDGRLRYPAPQPDLDEALMSARKAPLGDAWKWSRRNSTSADISPLVAVTLAFWAADTLKPRRPRVINLNDI